MCTFIMFCFGDPFVAEYHNTTQMFALPSSCQSATVTSKSLWNIDDNKLGAALQVIIFI